jgi:hypothetical protein
MFKQMEISERISGIEKLRVESMIARIKSLAALSFVTSINLLLIQGIIGGHLAKKSILTLCPIYSEVLSGTYYV